MAQQSKGNTLNTVVEVQNIGLGQLGIRNTYEDGLNDVAPTRHGDFVEVINPNDDTVSIHLTMNENIVSEDSDTSYTGDLAPGGSISGPFKSIQCTTANKEIIGVLSDNSGVDTLYFDGVNQSVDCGSVDSAEGISELTVSVWFKFFGQETDTYEIVTKGGYGIGSWTLIYGTSNNPDRMQFSVGSASYMWHGEDITRDEWHHVLVTYKADPSGDINYYLDGVHKDPTDLEIGYIDVPQTASIIKFGTGSNNTYSPMLISQVALFDSFLTDAQALDIYDSGMKADLTKSYDDDLIAYWKMNDGRYSLNVKDYASRPKRYRFDGTSNYIDLRDGITPPTGFPLGSSPRTISAWVQPSTVSGHRSIFSYGNAAVGEHFHFRQTNATLVAQNWNVDVVSPNCLTANSETHVVLVFDGDHGVKMYADGVEVKDGSFTAACDTTMGSYFSSIGAIHWSYTGNVGSVNDGFIREVGLWNEELDGDAIEAIYNSGKPLRLNRDSGDYTSTSALVGYWKINDGYDFTGSKRVHDMTGNNHGTYDDNSAWEGSPNNAVCVNMANVLGNLNWKRERI